MNVFEAATAYKKKGWSVIPLNPGDKKPAGFLLPSGPDGEPSWKEYQSRYATDEELHQWFVEASCNVGIVTGEISGLVVVDCDGQEGVDSAVQRGIKSNLYARTTRENGWHIYFSHPGERVGNKKDIFPSVDIRGDGGYVVGPGSVVNGKTYRWETLGAGSFEGVSPLPFPVETILQKPKTGPRVLKDSNWVSTALEEVKAGKNRRPNLLRVLGKLWNQGNSEGDMRTFLDPYVKASGLAPAEFDRLVRDVMKYDRDVTERGEMETKSMDDIMSVPPTSWLVEGALPKEGIAILSGLPGVGKTWLSLSLALSVCGGKGWLGRKVKENRVIYVDEENAESLLSERLQKLAFSYGRYGTDRIQFLISRGVNFSDQERTKKFREVVDNFRPGLIVIDSLVRVHSGEENSSGDMSRVFLEMRKLINDFGLCFLLLHHEGKGAYGRDTEDRDPTAGDNRGSNEIVASADAAFSLVKRKGGLTLFNTKVRCGEILAPIALELQIDSQMAQVNAVEFGG